MAAKIRVLPSVVVKARGKFMAQFTSSKTFVTPLDYTL